MKNKRPKIKMSVLTPQELGLIDGCTMSYQTKDFYLKERRKQLAQESQYSKDRYIVEMELFLKDTLDRFMALEKLEDSNENYFLNEYYGLLDQNGLDLIERLEKQ